MTLSVSIHDPVKTSVNVFTSGGKMHGCVGFYDAVGAQIQIYTTPDVARAIEDAFNAAKSDAAAIVAEFAEETAA